VDLIRLRAVAKKEWIQLRRDRRSMILAFVLPLFLLLFFGYAITWDVRDIPVVVLDEDRTPESRELVESLPCASRGVGHVDRHRGCAGDLPLHEPGAGGRRIGTCRPA
jgi:hypothetical protein